MRRFDFWLTKRIYILPFSLVLAVAVWFNSPGKRTDAYPTSAPDRDRIGQSVPLINERGGASDREPRARQGPRDPQCLSSLPNAVPSVSGWDSLCEHVALLSSVHSTRSAASIIKNSEPSVSVCAAKKKNSVTLYIHKKMPVTDLPHNHYKLQGLHLVIKMCWSVPLPSGVAPADGFWRRRSQCVVPWSCLTPGGPPRRRALCSLRRRRYFLRRAPRTPWICRLCSQWTGSSKKSESIFLLNFGNRYVTPKLRHIFNQSVK